LDPPGGQDPLHAVPLARSSGSVVSIGRGQATRRAWLAEPGAGSSLRGGKRSQAKRRWVEADEPSCPDRQWPALTPPIATTLVLRGKDPRLGVAGSAGQEGWQPPGGPGGQTRFDLLSARAASPSLPVGRPSHSNRTNVLSLTNAR